VTLRRIALGLAVAALVVVAALVLVAAVVEQAGPPSGAGDPSRHQAQVDAPRGAGRAGPPSASVPEGWARVQVGAASYAVPPGWSRRPASERVAYREDGAVIALGRGQAMLSVRACPLAWAVLADPVRSSNVRGVAEATALAWARGYAGLPDDGRLVVRSAAGRARVEIDLGRGSGCAGERAELTVAAQQEGARVVALVVARYLDVPGAPSDATYDGVMGSFRVAPTESG
jgi:hypothetical protein